MSNKPNKKIFGGLVPWKPIPLPPGPALPQLPQPASPKALKSAPSPEDRRREAFEPIISRTIEMDKFTAEVILRYRDLDGEHEIRTCPGDIYKIVNVFMDYARLLELVNDVLDMSKIESGKLSISHEPFNLRSSIQNINLESKPGSELEVNWK